MRLCVFCGSSRGRGDEYMKAARELGAACARNGIEIVYGGGRVGLMGAVADSALAENGRVVGVIPESLVDRELAHQGLSELRVVGSRHERKALMAELADAFVALPGGFGTLEELCEVITWTQLGIHSKPCAVVNVHGYYDALVATFDRAVSEGFISSENRGLVRAFPNVDAFTDSLTTHREHQSRTVYIPPTR